MQKIKIKSTILIAILIAIFSTIMCMGFVSAEEIGTNVDTIVGTTAHTINYYDKSGALIKTEGLLAGNNMTGIEGYEGNYVVRTDNYDELHNILTFVVPTWDQATSEYVYRSDMNGYYLFDNDSESTTDKISNKQYSDFIYRYNIYKDSSDIIEFGVQLMCNKLFEIPSNSNMYSNVSMNGSDSYNYNDVSYSYSKNFTTINFSDRTSMAAALKYTAFIGSIGEFTSIYDVGMTYSETTDNYVYYYLNETMSLDELTALNMDNVKSDTINVYTDIEPAQEPEEPTDEPTDEPSGDENGNIILPPSDKPSDTNKPSDETPIKEQSKLEKSNAELKAQWTALLAHDWQNAQGWQLITLMTITLAVAIAIIVTIPIVCHQIKKANNVKRIKARSAARKR